MKKTRSLIIMTAVLAALVGGFALFKLLGSGDPDADGQGETTAENRTEPLLKIDAEELLRVSLDNAGGKIVLEPHFSRPTPAPTTTAKESDLPLTGAAKADPTPAPDVLSWELQEPDVENLDQDAVNDLGKNLLTLSIIEDLGVKTDEELEAFGLDKPQATAVYEMKDGSSRTFYIGNEATASVSKNYYALDKESGRTALVSSTAEHLMTSWLSLIEKDVLQLDAQSLYAFSMKRSQDDFLLAAESIPGSAPTPAPQAQQGQGAAANMEWRMTSPVSWEGNAMTINNLVNELVQLRALKFMEYDASEAQSYGLDKPRYEITFRTAEGEKTLLIGESVSDKEAYAMIKGSPYVFTFNRSLLTQIGQQALDFYSPFAALVDITTVDKLTFASGEDLYVSEVFNPTKDETDAAEKAGKEKPEPSYTLNGRNASYENEKGNNVFTKYYQSLIGVKLAGFDTDAKPEKENYTYSISYIKRNGDPDISLHFVPRDQKTLYLIKNGEYTGFYVNKDDFTSDDNIDSPGVFYALDLMQKEMAKHDDTMPAAETTAGENGDN